MATESHHDAPAQAGTHNDRHPGLSQASPNRENTAYGFPLSRERQERTIADTRRRLASIFRQAGLDTSDLDARLLVGHALALDHSALAANAARAVTADEAGAIEALAVRRLAREPVARILGCKEFWGLPIRLGPATLVPRPDTETVVEAALSVVDAKNWRARPLRRRRVGWAPPQSSRRRRLACRRCARVAASRRAPARTPLVRAGWPASSAS